MSTQESIYNRIEDLLAANSDMTVIVAIDGRCGGGKTTLADLLSQKFSCPVVHMDDFFLRPEQRTEERLQKAGENIDHERFFKEVLTPLKQGKAARFRPFDCALGRLAAPKEVRGNLIIVEGSYSCHPNLWDQYDLRIFCDIDSDTQLKRIIKREGPQKAQMFESRWIPLEEKYFAEFDIYQRCDIVYLG